MVKEKFVKSKCLTKCNLTVEVTFNFIFSCCKRYSLVVSEMKNE